jgi:histone deacetylase HOS3
MIMQDGKLDMIQAASVSIHSPHSQFIENIHLEPFKLEEQFWDVHYRSTYNKLLSKAEDFVKNTGGTLDDTLVFIRQVILDVYLPLGPDMKAQCWI